MQRVRISHIEPGQRFDQGLFLSNGQKLLGPRIAVTDRHIQAMRRCGELEVLIAESVDELVEAGLVQRFDRKRLSVGQTSSGGLLTRGGSMLLEPGERIEQHHLDALEVSGDAFEAKNASSDRRQKILLADALYEDLEPSLLELPLRVLSVGQCPWIRPADTRDWPNPEKLSQLRDEKVRMLNSLYARIEAGVAVSCKAFDPILDDLMRRLAHHPTRFTQLALLCPRREDYLPDHAYTVAVLAMSVAANLKWSQRDVRQIGLAALLFDLGMLLVPQRIRTGNCQLSDMDRTRVQRHPVFSLSMLQEVKDVAGIVRLTAVQHHERENGSGYPRGRRKDNICDYARLLAVADTFAASTEPRHYRSRKLPYVAMEEVLRSAASMILWGPAVRGLVKAAGLFPVGSYVKLSSGENAHVIEANLTEVDRPVVQPLNQQGSAEGVPVDLARIDKATLAVVRPLAGPTG